MAQKKLQKKWRTFIARNLASAALTEPMTAVIAPSKDKWNDFGYQTLGTMFALDDRGNNFEGSIYIGIIGGKKFENSKAEALSRSLFNGDRTPITEAHKIFTMLPSMQAYRALVEFAGPDGARQILRGTRDIVLAQETRPIPKWSAEAKNSEAFTLSFMRGSESFFAYHNAGSILRGLRHEELGVTSRNICLRFRLDSFSQPHEIDFSFDPKSPLPKRIAVLIGKNGLGKSQALNRIVKFALDGEFKIPKIEDENPRALFDPNLDRPTFSRIVAIATPGETSFTFPPLPRKEVATEYRRLTLGRGSKKANAGGLAGMLVQLARSDDFIQDRSRWEIFAQAISEHLPAAEIFVRAKAHAVEPHEHLVSLPQLPEPGPEERRLALWGSIDESAEPVRKTRRGIYPLSSGQLAYLRFAVQACLHIENGTLVLVDEPETHLHPNLISAFVELLDRMLEFTGSIAIVATHSAYLVREVPRSQVHIVRETDEGGIEVVRPRLKTFGADVGTISMFIFEDDINNRLIEKVKQRLPRNSEARASYLANMNDDLSDEAKMELREVGEE